MQASRLTATIVRVVAFLLITAAVGKWSWKQWQQGKPSQSELADSSNDPQSRTLANQSHHVMVTYFTSDTRCITCKKIEKLTLEAVHEEFKSQLENKTLVFRTVNYDRPENQHFLKHYQLAFKTVVIAEHNQGEELQWHKYDDVWQLVNEPQAFKTYLQDGIRQHLTTITSTPDA